MAGKRQRTMSDQEIALAKAMIQRGIKNDVIHFYFNRSDRLISSGRITQIKQSKYGAAIPEASSAVLDDFLTAWKSSRSEATDVGGEAAPTSSAILLALFTKAKGAWKVLAGETDEIECKLSYSLNGDVLRTIGGFANNKGGYLLFGINPTTLFVEGLKTNHFSETDPARINSALASAFDPIPRIIKTTFELLDKTVGVIYVEKSYNPPLIALKNVDQTFKEGAIYFRYVGETRLIKPGELRQIIAFRERRAIAEFSDRMTRIADGRDATLNLDTGEVIGSSGDFVIDEKLLPSIQFLREGEFTERQGAAALKLIGDVKIVNSAEQPSQIIRESVTPNSIIKNFLLGQQVADPMQYIYAQAHSPRKWLPMWFYVEQSGRPVKEVIQAFSEHSATYPVSKNAALKRLRKKERAFATHHGRPTHIRNEIYKGNFDQFADGNSDMAFTQAIMGLDKSLSGIEHLLPLLLDCLERADKTNNGTLRSNVYRAACHLDELIHCSDE